MMQTVKITTKQFNALRQRTLRFSADIPAHADIEAIRQAIGRIEKLHAANLISAAGARDHLAKLGCVVMPLLIS